MKKKVMRVAWSDMTRNTLPIRISRRNGEWLYVPHFGNSNRFKWIGIAEYETDDEPWATHVVVFKIKDMGKTWKTYYSPLPPPVGLKKHQQKRGSAQDLWLKAFQQAFDCKGTVRAFKHMLCEMLDEFHHTMQVVQIK